jgi:hypothetical protein
VRVLRHYYIYLMEQEVAAIYFGQESKLFQLFSEVQQANQNHRNILQRQIDYVTRSITNYNVGQVLHNALHHRSDYRAEYDLHYIEMPNSEAKLRIHDGFITLFSNGSYESETIFFEVLRKIEPCFLAMDFNYERYGWLNPIKEIQFI